MTSIPALPLNDGHVIPQVGFGVFQVPPAETAAAVASALDAGYRSIDTARIYDNESGVGTAIAASGLPREQLYVTTKLWNDDHGDARAAFDASLERLGLDYVDLYLIHWPTPGQDLYVRAWETLIALRDEGRVRSIGVSNFQVHHLERLQAETDVVPAVNQIELHPRLTQDALRDHHAAHGIVTEAWSPLAQATILDHPTVAGIAAAHDRTPAQVVLRWHLQLGNVVIPKSVTPARITANLALFDFTLADDEVAAITALDEGARVGPDPDVFGA